MSRPVAIAELEQAATQYFAQEEARITEERDFLAEVIVARSPTAGVQSPPSALVSAYLSGSLERFVPITE